MSRLKNLEQPVDLLRGEGRGRLVENEQLAFVGQRLGDLDELHLGDAEARNQRGRRHVETDFVQQGRRAAVGLAIIHQTVALRQALEQEVFRHRHLRQHGKFLMHDADAGAVGVGRGSRAIGLAVKDDLALVGRIDAGEQIDERRLAGSVLAEQHVPFAACDLQGNAAQRDHAGEALADRLHGQDRIIHRTLSGSPKRTTVRKTKARAVARARGTIGVRREYYERSLASINLTGVLTHPVKFSPASSFRPYWMPSAAMSAPYCSTVASIFPLLTRGCTAGMLSKPTT